MDAMRLAVLGPGAGESPAMAARPSTWVQVSSAEAGERSERRLIREAQRGSEEALDALVRRHWPLAYRAAYLVVGDAAAAEDVAQEALIAAIRSLERFDRRRPFGPWLHRIAVNRAIDHVRARAARAEFTSGDAAETELRGGPVRMPPVPGDDPRGESLVAALGELSPEHRAIVAMRFLLDLTPGEIARELGLPRGTVNSRLRRALDQLGERIGEAGS